MGDAESFKRLDVVLRSRLEIVSLLAFTAAGSHEGDELTRDDPVEVAILYHFVVLVLQVVEVREVVPSQRNRDFETFHHFVGLQLVSARSHTGVSEVFERLFEMNELLPSSLSRPFEDCNLEGSYENNGVEKLFCAS